MPPQGRGADVAKTVQLWLTEWQRSHCRSVLVECSQNKPFSISWNSLWEWWTKMLTINSHLEAFNYTLPKRWASRETVGTWYRGSFLYCRMWCWRICRCYGCPQEDAGIRRGHLLLKQFSSQCPLGKTSTTNLEKGAWRIYKGPVLLFLYVFETEE